MNWIGIIGLAIVSCVFLLLAWHELQEIASAVKELVYLHRLRRDHKWTYIEPTGSKTVFINEAEFVTIPEGNYFTCDPENNEVWAGESLATMKRVYPAGDN